MRSIVLAAVAASVVVCLFLGASAFLRARAKGRFYSLSTLFFGAALYSTFYAFELAQPDLSGVLKCVGFEYIGIQALIVSLFFMIRDFRGDESPPLGMIVLASAIPALTVIVAFTVRSHDLLYIDPSVSVVNGLTILRFGRGPWYWVNIFMLYGVFAFGAFQFAKAAGSGVSGRRTQAVYMLAGSSTPFIANVIYVAGLSPSGADPTPLAFAIGGLFFSAGFFKHRLFDVHPIARDAVFEHMRDAALVIDDDGTIVDSNEAARALFPQLVERQGGITFSRLCEDHPGLLGALARGNGRDTVSLASPKGELRFEAHRSRVKNKGGRKIGLLLMLYDVTQRELMQDKLRELASLDELTRVANRRRFYELAGIELERARRHGRSIAFAIMDMNGFKRINDRYGHGAGDDALRLAARLCVDTLRSCDIVGRVGGDEFAFVFPECDEAGAFAAVQKLRAVIGSATFTSGTSLVRLSASFGAVGSVGPAHPDLEEFLSVADKRMYADKPRARAARAKPA